jgi:hypothetical protein
VVLAGEVIRRSVAGAGSNQSFDLLDRLNAATGADSGAVERSSCTGELKLFLKWTAAKHGQDKSGMKNVTGARGVDRLDLKSSSVVKLRTVPGEHAILAEGCGGEAVAETGVNRGQRFAQIVVAGQFAGDVAAGNQVIDVGQERFDARIEFIEVRDHGNVGLVCPRCGLRGCGSVVTVDMESAGMNDPIAPQFFGHQFQPLVTLPEDGALPEVVHKNEGLLAGAVWNGNEMSFHACAGKFGVMNGGGVVVADFADVASAQSPLLASDNGAGDLATGQDHGGANLDFGTTRGKVRDGNERVRGVESNAYEIDFFCVGGSGH